MTQPLEFRRIAILNRGEAALRFLRALRDYNIERSTSLEAVAFITHPDRHSPCARQADEVVDLGSPFVLENDALVSSYCAHEYVIGKLKEARCEAVWPGWGFVSEDPLFVKRLEEEGIHFLGPSSDAMQRLGDKIASKQLAESCDVPLAPWGMIEDKDDETSLLEKGAAIGYPLMVKASAGGGGRGIRKVNSADELLHSIQLVRDEVKKSFGQGGVFMERCITGARHIEVQLVAGADGKTHAVGIRDCTLQRRNQKVLEESPSPVLPEAMAVRLKEASVRLAEAAGYKGVGTAEYLYDPSNGMAAFLEVNSRLQVEHTVTELRTGLDLVQAQIDIARELDWTAAQKIVEPRGHAIEVRLNAENPELDFQPSPGLIQKFKIPSGPGIRVDSGVSEKMEIPPDFDSMIAKVLAWGSTREQAIARMQRALQEMEIIVQDGATNKAFLLQLVQHPVYTENTAHTQWLDGAIREGGLTRRAFEMEALQVAAVLDYRFHWQAAIQRFFKQVANGIPQHVPQPEGRQSTLRVRDQRTSLTVLAQGENEYLVGEAGNWHAMSVEIVDAHSLLLHVDGNTHQVLHAWGKNGVTVEVDGVSHLIEHDSGGVATAPAPSVVVHVAVEEGEHVEPGDLLCTLEVMKMEMPVFAREAGLVRSILCHVNQQVQSGQSLILLALEGEGEQGGASESLAQATPPIWQQLWKDRETRAYRLDLFEEAESTEIVSSLLESVRAVLLGYDIATDWVEQWDRLAHVDMTFADLQKPERWTPLLEVLETFVDQESLFDRVLLPRANQPTAISAELDFYEYCRRHQEGEEGISRELQPLLLKALRWYGVESLEPGYSLREALLRLVVAHNHSSLRHRFCSSLLRMLMELHAADVQLDNRERWRPLLRKVAQVAQRDYPFVADNARQAYHVLFEEPLYAHSYNERRRLVQEHLGQLREVGSESQERQQLLETLIQSRQTVLPLLLRYGSLHPTETSALAEVFAKRTYARKATLDTGEWLDEQTLFLRGSREDEGDAKPLWVFVGLESELSFVLKQWQEQCNTASIPDELHCEVVLLGKVDKEGLTVEMESLSPNTAGQSWTLTWCNGSQRMHHRSFVATEEGWEEQVQFTDVHPAVARRLELHRLQEFTLTRLPSPEQIYAFDAQARTNSRDRRLFVLAEVMDVPTAPDPERDHASLQELEQRFFEGVQVIRKFQSRQRRTSSRYHWNRILLFVRPSIDVGSSQIAGFAQRFEASTRGLGLQKVVVHVNLRSEQGEQKALFTVSKRGRHNLEVNMGELSDRPIRAMTTYSMNVVKAHRRGLLYPYEILRILEGHESQGSYIHPDLGDGCFVEMDLDDSGERLVKVQRERGENEAGVVVGIISNKTRKFPEGMERVWIASDPTKAMGSLSEPECRRVLAALNLAEERGLPVEWLPLSAGALISMNSGTENLDWTARVLRKIVQFTQSGGLIHLIIVGVNVGAQSYWNAEATMLMHTRGVLIMTPESSMVLTGKKALDYSGSVSGPNEIAIGGFDRVMGPNGQAHFFADSLGEAYSTLFEYYRFSYVKPGEDKPRCFETTDPVERNVLDMDYAAEQDSTNFNVLGDIFDPAQNPGRKKPFAIREVMRAVIDQDGGWLERFQAMRHADTAVVWDAHLGGTPVSVVGFESRPTPRRGRIPMDGPDIWSGGTLYPQSSKKVARALNAASGNRPVVLLANLSGFDGSPESLRKLQLEMGAEIGRAVVNFEGPLFFVVVGRYHGGAYVVFSKALNPNLTALAVEGAYASVIGGAPAAAVVFPREVKKRMLKDSRILELNERMDNASPSEKPLLREERETLEQQVVLEKQGEVAREFDAIHTVQRAVEQGSLDEVIAPATLRPRLIELLKQRLH
jgi:acetyl/propionyl-CoA carboxylase alpha subunit/acetyl-CoA carboxylase carboxyltransferase component